jgi:hypothetical protein
VIVVIAMIVVMMVVVALLNRLVARLARFWSILSNFLYQNP